MNLFNRCLVYHKNRISVSDYVKKLGFFDEEFSRYEKMENHFGEYFYGKGLVELYTKRYIKTSIMQQLSII